MDFNQAKTPYNSINADMKNPKLEGELVCCAHGKECNSAKASLKTDNNQYINLSSPKKMKTAKLVDRVNQILVEENEERKPKTELMSLNSFIANNIVEAKRSKRDRKKKKAAVIVDDNQSYVMLGNTSDDASSQTKTLPHSSAPPPTEVTAVKSNVFSKTREALSAYIGVLTLSEAENRLTRRGEFALYHLVSLDCRLDTISEFLPLLLVYRTTTKKFRHYPIRLSSDFHFFVDCGYPNVRKHYSLNQLVLYYKTSATCEINPDDTSADSFSWWLE